jgi:hypothetical protein
MSFGASYLNGEGSNCTSDNSFVMVGIEDAIPSSPPKEVLAGNESNHEAIPIWM